MRCYKKKMRCDATKKKFYELLGEIETHTFGFLAAMFRIRKEANVNLD